MAIQYVGGVVLGRAGATSTTTQSLTALTGGIASAPAAGDLVVVWCSVATAAGYVPTTLAISGNNSGAYTTETMQTQTAVANYTYAQLSYKVMGATPDTSLTIPSSGNARNAQGWAVHVFRGVNGTTPFNVTSVNANGSATGRPNPGAITPTTAGSWILWMGASAAATGATYTAPTDFSTNWRTRTDVDTYDEMLGFGYYTGWTSGQYDPAAITVGGTTGATDSWVAKTAVIQPASSTSYTLTCSKGDYTSSGKTSTLTYGRSVSGAVGGYSSAGFAATLTPVHKYALTCAVGSYSTSGVASILTYAPGKTDYVLTCDVGSYTQTGRSATTVYGHTLSGAVGSYSSTGFTATLNRGHSLTCTVGTYATSGFPITVQRTYSLNCAVGAYTSANFAATLSRGYTQSNSTGSYTYSGVASTLTHSQGQMDYSLTCNVGSYSSSGRTTTITYGRAQANTAGVFASAGFTATFVRGYSLTCAAGSYSAAVTNASLVRARALQAAVGSYNTSGFAATLRRDYSLNGAIGAYALSGNAATLSYYDGSAVQYNHTLSCATGVLTAAFGAATFHTTHAISLDPKAYVRTVNPISVTFDRKMACEGWSLSAVGNAAVLRRAENKVLAAGTWGLNQSGTNSTLVVGRALTLGTGSIVVSGGEALFDYHVTHKTMAADVGSYAVLWRNANLLHAADAKLYKDAVWCYTREGELWVTPKESELWITVDGEPTLYVQTDTPGLYVLTGMSETWVTKGVDPLHVTFRSDTL